MSSNMLQICLLILICIFFFKQKTAYEFRIRDWSSDVCSSDLPPRPQPAKAERRGNTRFDQYRAGGQGAVRLAEIRNRLRLALALPVGEILSDILLEHLGIAIACD